MLPRNSKFWRVLFLLFLTHTVWVISRLCASSSIFLSFCCVGFYGISTIVGCLIPTPLYHHHHHDHHVVPRARISLTLSRHFSLSFIASGRSSGLHPVSLHSCCMYVRAGRPAFARPYVGVHRSTSLMSPSLLLQQCPARLAKLDELDNSSLYLYIKHIWFTLVWFGISTSVGY